MKAAVICEFNPFHNGHKFLFENIKSRYRCDVVCIMSGNFVQRGDIAVTDKYARTRIALENGADMVAELPTVYAVSSAKIFAENGVRLAHALGCDTLSFGAENTLDELKDVALALNTDAVQTSIKENMKNGSYYPRALENALKKESGAKAAEVIKKPNNILALEYIRACEKYAVSPIAFERVGTSHDSDIITGNIASASKIRDMIKNGEDISAFSPMIVKNPVFLNRLESAILYALKTKSEDDLARLAEVSEGLHHRIFEIAHEYNSFEEILKNLKTKRYTMARLRRILIYALLSVSADMQNSPVPYVRVLGVRSDKTELITANNLPIIADVRREYDELKNSSKEIFDVDIRATEAMNIAKGTDAQNEFSVGLIKI